MNDMTGQFADKFNFENISFDIVGVSGQGFFNPQEYKLEPYSSCTACWRGFLVTYTIHEKILIVENLKINLKEDIKINGKKPIASTSDKLFKFEYPNLNVKIIFTGTILIAKDMMPEMYVHMGFQRPIAYKRVIELKFKNGKMVSTQDLSEQIAQERKENPTKDAQPKPDENVSNWIKRTFSLDKKK